MTTTVDEAQEAVESRPYFEIANLEIPELFRALPRELTILDVGCGSGVHGAELKRIYNHHVVGVDNSRASIAKARTRLDSAHLADVTQPAAYPLPVSTKFDLILFSDILEHLYDPAAVLTAHLSLLKPGGHVVIAIPNIAIWSTRIELLFGRFRYRETGTLDRTHIRFFDYHTFQELLASCRLRQEIRRTTPGLLRPFVPLVKALYRVSDGGDRGANRSSIMDSKPYRLYCQFFYPVERLLCSLWPGLLAFQYVARCTRRD